MIKTLTQNQWDARWADKQLGNALLPNGQKVTMRNSGCYLTTIANGLNVNAGDLCDKMNSIGGFDDSGMLKWEKLEQAHPEVVWFDSQWTTVFTRANNEIKVEILTALSRLKKLVSLGFPILLCVDNRGNDKWPDHAVLLYEAPDDLTQWKIKNPDGGADTPFSDRYGSPMTGVYGWRTILNCPTSWPDSSTRLHQDIGIAAWKGAVAARALTNVPSDIRVKLPTELNTYVRELPSDLLN